MGDHARLLFYAGTRVGRRQTPPTCCALNHFEDDLPCRRGIRRSGRLMQHRATRRYELGDQPYPGGSEHQYQTEIGEHIINGQDHSLLPG